MKCPKCSAHDFAIAAIEPEDPACGEWWRCLECGLMWTDGTPFKVRELGAPLDAFELSLIAHQTCRTFRAHHYCTPLVWLRDMEVGADGSMVSKSLGIFWKPGWIGQPLVTRRPAKVLQ